jgi:hypothetical protein
MSTWLRPNPFSNLIMTAVLLATLLAPVSGWGARTVAQKHHKLEIHAVDIALIYAGLIGALIGAATGWIFLMPSAKSER